MAAASFLLSKKLIASPETVRQVSRRPIRRRSSRSQGEALSLLGHAIEYLIDSRIPEGGTSYAENEAIRMMMHASRAVFAECEEVVPLRRRIFNWMGRQLRPRETREAHPLH